MNALRSYADEVAALAADLDAARFTDSEKYVIDSDALRRKLRDLAERMRRTASEQPKAAASGRIVIERTAILIEHPQKPRGRSVVVERRRRR